MIYIIEMIGCVSAMLFWQYGFVEKNNQQKTRKQKLIGLLGASSSFLLMIIGFVLLT